MASDFYGFQPERVITQSSGTRDFRVACIHYSKEYRWRVRPIRCYTQRFAQHFLDAADEFFLGGLQHRRRGPDTYDFGERLVLMRSEFGQRRVAKPGVVAVFGVESSMAW